MFRILHDTKYDFIKHWRHAAIATIAFIIVGLTVLGISGLHRSIEFTGGTFMQVHFTTAPGADAVRAAVDAAGFAGSQIQEYGKVEDYSIRAQAKTAADSTGEAAARAIEAVLHQKFGDTTQVK